MSKKILIVEDDRFISTAYSMKLGKLGYEFQIAGDGVEALEILKKSKPDLIILDLVLPKMNGFEFLERIKKDKNMRNIPVIISSNLGLKSELERADALGVDDFIIKTDLEINRLGEKIEKLFSERVE